MELFSDALEQYLTSLVPNRDPVLLEMESRAERDPFPILGPVAGYLAYFLARLHGARSIFEMGSGYGYSTAWFARAVKENGGGTVHHTVWDDDLSRDARGYLQRLGYGDTVAFHAAEAMATLAQEPGPFDVIFNDIEKSDYPASLSLIKQKLRPSGLLLMDNMLWSGRVFDEESQSDSSVGVRTATKLLFSDPDFRAVLLPVRDGLVAAQLIG